MLTGSMAMNACAHIAGEREERAFVSRIIAGIPPSRLAGLLREERCVGMCP